MSPSKLGGTARSGSRSGKEMDWKDVVLTVGDELSEREEKAFFFLCKHMVDQDALTSVIKLFDCLEKRGHLTEKKPQLLAELLSIISRDLLTEKLGLTKPTAESLVCTDSLFRKWLYQLSEEITPESLAKMKLRLNEFLPRKKLDEATALELFVLMEDNNLLSKTKLGLLQKIIAKDCPNLKKKILQYKQQQHAPGGRRTRSQGFPGGFQVSPAFGNTGSLEARAEAPETLSARQRRASSPRPASRTGRAVSDLSRAFCQSVFWALVTVVGLCMTVFSCAFTVSKNLWAAIVKRPGVLSSYPMNSGKRGFLLIISNYDFTNSIRPMDNREGTQFDEKALWDVFDWLGFTVELCRNYKAAEIRSVVRKLSRMDHSQVDCLACCILSHGGKGSVYGVDGRAVQISKLTGYFDGLKCPTLVGKPKMFFIQACQGVAEQTGVHVPDGGVFFEPVCCDAAPETIPAQSDILLAMSTVPAFCSYRNCWKGSWFIQSLCRNLVKMVPRGYDILSILLEVNHDVSKKTAGRDGNKQMPQPSFSLRKKVVFPVPAAPPPILTDHDAADGAARISSVPDGPVLPSQRCSPFDRPTGFNPGVF